MSDLPCPPQLIRGQENNLDTAVLSPSGFSRIRGNRDRISPPNRRQTLRGELCMRQEVTNDLGRPGRGQLPIRGEPFPKLRADVLIIGVSFDLNAPIRASG